MPLPHPSDLIGDIDFHAISPPGLIVPRPESLIEGAVTYANISYAHPMGWRPLLLDLHLPQDCEGPFPVVLYVHGGSFLGGIKEMGPWTSLPAQGIAVASINYRLSGEVAFPEPIEDVRAAVRWIHARGAGFDLDPHRVSGWGSSAGAYLVSMASLTGESGIGRPIGHFREHTSRMRSIVLHYTTSDFAYLAEDAFDNSDADIAALLAVARNFLRFDPATPPAGAPPSSAVETARTAENLVPVLLAHGDADHRVGVGQSLRMHRMLVDRGADSTIIVVPKADHADPVFWEKAQVDTVVDFLRRTWVEEADVSDH